MTITVMMNKKTTAMMTGMSMKTPMMKLMVTITVMTIPRKAIAMTNTAMTAIKRKTATMTTVMAADLMVTNMEMSMTWHTDRMSFGVFMGPFHPLGENPTLSLQRDLELIQWLDEQVQSAL